MKHNSSASASGIVVLCDWQGVIEKVMHDGLGLTSRLKVGQPFASAMGGDGDQQFGREAELAGCFMTTLRDSGYAFGWEMQVPVQGNPTVLRFTGGATNNGVLIVGEAAHSDGSRVVEELMRINNETVNALRTTVKQAALSSQSRNEHDNELLAELSRANNGVMTAQRELAKKNAILSQTIAALEEARTALEGKQAALEEANVRLDALATMDGLTGVKNRRAFGEKLTEEIPRSVRYALPLSLLLLDVDKFKQYNDTFGHLAGDEILKTVARLLREQARTTDFVARYGGEEFTLVLPNTNADGAVVMAERVRAVIESAPWPQRAVTASFGAATLSPDTSTETALIGAADRALYASKENGRNQVTHAHALSGDSGDVLAQARP